MDEKTPKTDGEITREKFIELATSLHKTELKSIEAFSGDEDQSVFDTNTGEKRRKSIEEYCDGDGEKFASFVMLRESWLYKSIVQTIDEQAQQDLDDYDKAWKYFIGTTITEELRIVFEKIVHYIAQRKSETPRLEPENEVESAFISFLQTCLDQAKEADPSLAEASLDQVFDEGFDENGAPIPGRFRFVTRLTLVRIPAEFLDLDPDDKGSAFIKILEAWAARASISLAELKAQGEKDKKQRIADAQLASILSAEDGSVPKLLTDRFLPIYSAQPLNEFMRASVKKFEFDPRSKKGTYRTKSGSTLTIENCDKLLAGLGTGANKLFDVGAAALARQNYNSTRNPNPIVRISLHEYAEANGIKITPERMDTPEEQKEENKKAIQRLKDFKKAIRRDLEDMASLHWTGSITKGKEAGDYADLKLLSTHGVSNGVITMVFDAIHARILVNAPIVQWPTTLLKHDNRNPNAYAIGRRIASHFSMDNNAAAGTNKTLSVKSLLEAAPKIISIKKIEEQDQRFWRDRIKKPLELALDENIRIGFLSEWAYRDPKTKERISKESANVLQWSQYESLMVDFEIIDPPDQTERRAKRAEEKAQAAIASGKEKKKRGRPKKEEKRETDVTIGGN